MAWELGMHLQKYFGVGRSSAYPWQMNVSQIVGRCLDDTKQRRLVPSFEVLGEEGHTIGVQVARNTRLQGTQVRPSDSDLFGAVHFGLKIR